MSKLKSETPDYKRGIDDASNDLENLIQTVIQTNNELQAKVKELKIMLSRQQTKLNEKIAQIYEKDDELKKVKQELEQMRKWYEVFKTFEKEGKINEKPNVLRI